MVADRWQAEGQHPQFLQYYLGGRSWLQIYRILVQHQLERSMLVTIAGSAIDGIIGGVLSFVDLNRTMGFCFERVDLVVCWGENLIPRLRNSASVPVS
jgi:hypothetical protein